MQHTYDADWTTRVCIVFIFLILVHPFQAEAQLDPARAIAENVYITYAMDEVQDIHPCVEASFNTENCTAARNEFMTNFYGVTRCDQTLNFESFCPVVITGNELSSTGLLHWQYTVDGSTGPIVAQMDVDTSIGSSAIVYEISNNTFANKDNCPYCSSCSSCLSFLSTYSDQVDIQFSTPVGGVSLFLSQLADSGAGSKIRLYHADASISEWDTIPSSSGNDASFFGAYTIDHTKAIARLKVIPGSRQRVGVDEIFIATVEQTIPPPPQYGYPVANINMNNPTLICTSNDAANLTVDGSTSYIAEMVDPNSIVTFAWTLENLLNSGDIRYYYNPTGTISNVAPGLYTLDLVVSDELDQMESDSIGLAVGQCEDLGPSSQEVIFFPIVTRKPRTSLSGVSR